MKFWKITLSAILAIVLFGCAGKYQPPQDLSTPVAGLTKSQVKKAILDAETPDQGNAFFGIWKMKSIDNNTIQGKLFSRGHEVVVNISYTAKGYTIKYVSVSEKLKNKEGNVHRKYNQWVNKLDAKIRQNIFKQ